MNLKLSDKFIKGFVSQEEIDNLTNQAKAALNLVKDGTGAGNDFLGWYDLPINYDKDEFERIKKASEKIIVIFTKYINETEKVYARA